MKILLIAYAIEPGKGSEEGIGYHFCKEIAGRFQDVTLMTRPNNIPALKADPAFLHVRLIGIDVPKAIGFFKNKHRGVHLYYYLWQRVVGWAVRNMNEKFDIIHQITFAAAWAPHFLSNDNGRVIWGPLLNHAPIPKQFLFYRPLVSGFKDDLKQILKKYFLHYSPAMHRAVSGTNIIFFGSPSLQDKYGSQRSIPLTAAGTRFKVADKKEQKEKFLILFVGRFVDLKGCIPALEAFQRFYNRLSAAARRNVSMRYVGAGPLEELLRKKAQENNLPVDFLPWQEQNSLESLYDEATIFLFPSFEGQGLAVVEAMARGCPVICFEGTGPSFLAGGTGLTTPALEYSTAVSGLAERLLELYCEHRDRPEVFEQRVQKTLARAREFAWEKKMDAVIEAYHAKSA